MMSLATIAEDIVYIPRNDDWVIAWKVGSDVPGREYPVLSRLRACADTCLQ
jgi:hypothetical protein